MTRWALALFALAALLLPGCGSERERGINTNRDRPKRGDKSSTRLPQRPPGADDAVTASSPATAARC